MASEHPRTIIKKYIKGLILSHTDVDAAVETNRVRPVAEGDLPRILIYDMTEPVDYDIELNIERNLEVRIEILRKIGSNLDDELDFTSAQVEEIMSDDTTLGGLANQTQFQGTVKALQKEGSTEMGSSILTYFINYFEEKLTGFKV